MTSIVALSVLRRFAASSSTRLVLRQKQQRRWAQVHDIRLIAMTRTVHNVMDRYRARLDEKARTEGHGSIEGLREAYKDKIGDIKRRDVASISNGATPAPLTPPSVTPSPPPPPAEAATTPSEAAKSSTSPQGEEPTNAAWTVPGSRGRTAVSSGKRGRAQHKSELKADSETQDSGVKPLSAILDMSKARALPPPELKAIWRLRYAHNPQALCAVIPAATYRAMEDLARRCPQFVLPVPRVWDPSSSSEREKSNEWEALSAAEEREGGAEIHFLQWVWDAETRTSTVLFTGLAEFKLRGEFAVPHTTVTHHLDFADDKDIVLMQGNVIEGRGVSPEDAKWLVMCLQRFYGAWGAAATETAADGERIVRAAERRRLLEWFAAGDERFTIDKLMEEAERMG